jgi:alkylated DNA repair protein alkB family protein 6
MVATPASATDETGQGKPIAAIPLANLLLMPRSLLILSSSLYTSHLHAIAARTSDVVIDRGAADRRDDEVVVANQPLIGDSSVLDKIREEGRWIGERGTRTSLTFRHAEKVLKGKAFAMATNGLRRS